MIRAAWICHFSDPAIRAELTERESGFERFLVRRILRRGGIASETDRCIWNSLGIREFSRMEDIELHVVMPYNTLTGGVLDFEKDGVHYHCYPEQGSYFKNRIIKCFRPRKYRGSTGNVRKVRRILKVVKPDMVHLIGAESRDISPCVDAVPEGTPLVVQLQTLLESPGFRDGYYLSDQDFNLLAGIERHAIMKADYIGTSLEEFRCVIRSFRPDAKFLDTRLAVGVDVSDSSAEPKQFDFVYFALHIEKSADWAVEAFAEALKEEPGLTLDIVGNASPDFKASLERRIEELGIGSSIKYEGALPTHDDVLMQIRRSRFALLPLKVDFVSGTVREAMAGGLPVVTSVTDGTPTLNEKRESVLLSPAGDHSAMAANMISLVRDPQLAIRLKDNAILTVEEKYSNRTAMLAWASSYRKILSEWPLR